MKITDETTVGELKDLMGQKGYVVDGGKIQSGPINKCVIEPNGYMSLRLTAPGGHATFLPESVFVDKASLKDSLMAGLDEQKRKLEAGELDEDE